MKFHPGLRTCAGLLALCAVFVIAGRAQTESAALKIFVEDATQSPILGASVKLTNEETNAASAQATEAEGYATFRPLPPGLYTAEVLFRGFRGARVNHIVLNVAAARLETVILQPSTVTETLEVQAN